VRAQGRGWGQKGDSFLQPHPRKVQKIALRRWGEKGLIRGKKQKRTFGGQGNVFRQENPGKIGGERISFKRTGAKKDWKEKGKKKKADPLRHR